MKRTVFAEVPPRVLEYEMTPAARALQPVFDELFAGPLLTSGRSPVRTQRR